MENSYIIKKWINAEYRDEKVRTRHAVGAYLISRFPDDSFRIYYYTQGHVHWRDTNSNLHRMDGPAITDPQLKPVRYWYYHGTHIPCSSQQEFERILKLKGFW